jgi:PEGA domain
MRTEGDAGMRSHRGQWSVASLALVAMLGLSGCVERRYTIRTDPPGAKVIANGEDIGTTPVSKSFTFYGDRTFRIIKEGYETKDIVEKFKAPWYDNYLTEFFTENLNPYTFRDEVEFNYKLEPARAADSNDVLSRAEAVRIEGQAPPIQRKKTFLGLFDY